MMHNDIEELKEYKELEEEAGVSLSTLVELHKVKRVKVQDSRVICPTCGRILPVIRCYCLYCGQHITMIGGLDVKDNS